MALGELCVGEPPTCSLEDHQGARGEAEDRLFAESCGRAVDFLLLQQEGWGWGGELGDAPPLNQVTEGVCSFLGSPNAAPQSGWLQATDIYCLIALEAQSLKSRSRVPLKALKEDPFLSPPASLKLLVSWQRHANLCLCHPMAIFSLCVCLFSSHKDTSGIQSLLCYSRTTW